MGLLIFVSSQFDCVIIGLDKRLCGDSNLGVAAWIYLSVLSYINDDIEDGGCGGGGVDGDDDGSNFGDFGLVSARACV